ncbi:MAG: IS110 family transposase [Nocardioidaceae bacterium]
MPTVADVIDDVIGVDTHTDTHTLVCCSPAGAVRGELTVDNSTDGFAEALTWATMLASGPSLIFGIEGTRSYGQAFSEFLSRAGLVVVEVERPARRSARTRRGKSDPIDAKAAAHQVLAMDPDALPTPRADGDREALRILLVARRALADECKKANARLRALLLTGTDTDRALLRGPRLSKTTLTGLTRRRGSKGEDRATTTRRREITRLANQQLRLLEELRANNRDLATITDEIAPGLTSEHGVGPVSAAQLIVSYSHRGRVRSEAAFAALAGVSPVQASSGRRTRHRLNRGGDRQLNRALHDIARTRMRDCPNTRAYVTRRTSETPNFTTRDARRCLKRYLARHLYRRLETIMTLGPGPTT